MIDKPRTVNMHPGETSQLQDSVTNPLVMSTDDENILSVRVVAPENSSSAVMPMDSTVHFGKHHNN